MSEDATPFDLPPAYFLSLTLENVRCFGPEQALDLTNDDGQPAQWTVLLGDNGTGKTTLLQAIVGMEPVRMPSTRESEQIELSPRFLIEDFPTSFERCKEASEFKAKVVSGSRLKEEGKTINKELAITIWRSERFGRTVASGREVSIQKYGGLSCFAYGAGRTMATGALEEREINKLRSLFTEEAELPNAEEWLLQTDYAAKSEKPKAKRRLEEIEEVLANPDSGILPDVDDLRFAEQEGETSPPRVEFHTPYGWVTIDQLSLGYRTMIAWVVDLARRLFERYPESDNPLAEPAVCLVDEIDLHLHPKWQRKIIDFLSERFPNTQFIVTAHSPLVVQAAEDANIALLERVEVEDGDDYVEIENNPARIRNWRVDQILTSDLFDLDSARPPKADKLMQEREEILAKEELTEDDEERLDEIEEELGDLPTGETPDDIEAMNLIRQAARELKEDA
jgi:energy-coupling factor transporter ATP-binding protein EcfA2